MQRTKEMRKVSAIITTHNRLELLKRAIKSVKTQTYPNIECIVVSDNSSDGTDEYCSSLEDVIFISIPAKESRGGNYARNLGIKKSQGEYVAFLDDDDYWIKDKIEKQINIAENNHCGLVYCGLTFEDVLDETTHYTTYLPKACYSGDVSKIILTTIFTTTSEILVKKSLLEQVGYFDENLKFWQEYELSIRLSQITPFLYVDEALTVYRRDYRDKNRLTNKYSGWKDSVNYIHMKHKFLYNKLSFKEKLCAKQFYWTEAIARCKSSSLPIHENYYRIKLWISTLPFRIKHIIWSKKTKE